MRKPNSPETLALDLLRRSRLNVQMAAVIIDKHDRFVSWGWNHGYIHAEAHAIGRANPRRLPGSFIFIAGKRRKSGNLVEAKPCPHCQALIDACKLHVKYLGKDNHWHVMLSMQWRASNGALPSHIQKAHPPLAPAKDKAARHKGRPKH